MEKELVVRSRGIIYYNEKILLVKHDKDFDYYALPGGHLEWAEDPKECVIREIIEELGVVPKIGRLLYINTFVNIQNTHAVEFFFEILNTEDYLDVKKLKGIDSDEIFEIRWISKEDGIKILPDGINRDFLSGNLLADNIRFLKN